MGAVLLGDLWSVWSSDLSSAGSLGHGRAILGKNLSLSPGHDLEPGKLSSGARLDLLPTKLSSDLGQGDAVRNQHQSQDLLRGMGSPIELQKRTPAHVSAASTGKQIPRAGSEGSEHPQHPHCQAFWVPPPHPCLTPEPWARSKNYEWFLLSLRQPLSLLLRHPPQAAVSYYHKS